MGVYASVPMLPLLSDVRSVLALVEQQQYLLFLFFFIILLLATCIPVLLYVFLEYTAHINTTE